MNILFEEEGHFKTAAILTENDTSLQVETASGKRIKLKAANGLLRFKEPGITELLSRAQAEADKIDTAFLWEMCGDAEFMFNEFAQEYFGHVPNAVEATSVLLALHAAPVYFHRKGRGRFRKAPPEILQAALAGQEKKRQQQQSVERMRDALLRGELPSEFAPIVPNLLYKPDRNRLEVKALEDACTQSGQTPAQLLLQCGALASSYDYHFGRFAFEYFPHGTAHSLLSCPLEPQDLPVAQVRAFSIDDASTTEIDDAFSLTPIANGWRIGIHIAAPGLGIQPQDPIGQIARRRLSTVYMPGNKITMLPDEVVSAYTLGAGTVRAALSLYVDVDADFQITAQMSCIEQVPVVANLRLHEIEPLFNAETLQQGLQDFVWRKELEILYAFAHVLEQRRGKPSAQNLHDYIYAVDWNVSTIDGPGFVSLAKRQRGAPLDKLVSELMILTNRTWGRMLADANIPAIYRAQGGGRVRMTTTAAPHEGLGVDCYAWSSSPLRRYVDLINQWQLIAHLREQEPSFVKGNVELASAMNDFDLTYSAYNDFQRGLERYWCLRALRQGDIKTTTAIILRENLVRLESVPFTFKLSSLPNELMNKTGARVEVKLEEIDLLNIDIKARFVADVAGDDANGIDITEELE